MESLFKSLSRRIVIFTGAFGSGKTEVAVNFAEAWVRVAPDVAIADLDIVNLYFRSRDVRAQLEAAGLSVIAPPEDQEHADLPIVVPQVRGAIRNRKQRLVLDVGGNDLGARVLASFSDVMDPADGELWIVVNANRPFTEDAVGAERVLRSIEAASGLAVTGLVANTHLMDQTTIEGIVEGYRMAEELGRAVGVGIRFAVAAEELADAAARELPVPVLRLVRRMLPPFRRRSPGRAVPGRPLGKPGKEILSCLE